MQTESKQAVASEGRRRLIKALAVGGATAALLPEKWVRPVMDRIIVPAHAQTSVVNPFVGIYTNGGPNLGQIQNNLFERLVGVFIPTAHAVQNTPCPNACVAFQVFSNTDVTVYVNGDTRSSSINPITGKIFDVSVNSYSFSNCIVENNSLTGFSASCGGEFTLPKSNEIPQFCSKLPS